MGITLVEARGSERLLHRDVRLIGALSAYTRQVSLPESESRTNSFWVLGEKWAEPRMKLGFLRLQREFCSICFTLSFGEKLSNDTWASILCHNISIMFTCSLLYQRVDAFTPPSHFFCPQPSDDFQRRSSEAEHTSHTWHVFDLSIDPRVDELMLLLILVLKA